MKVVVAADVVDVLVEELVIRVDVVVIIVVIGLLGVIVALVVVVAIFFVGVAAIVCWLYPRV